VGGGRSNKAEGEYATVAGGYGNAASNDDATVCGGGSNKATQVRRMPGSRFLLDPANVQKQAFHLQKVEGTTSDTTEMSSLPPSFPSTIVSTGWDVCRIHWTQRSSDVRKRRAAHARAEASRTRGSTRTPNRR
jgi:hypothetical protein